MLLLVPRSSTLAALLSYTCTLARRFALSYPSCQEFKKCSFNNRLYHLDFRFYVRIISSAFCNKLLIINNLNKIIWYVLPKINGFWPSKKELLVLQDIHCRENNIFNASIRTNYRMHILCHLSHIIRFIIFWKFLRQSP